ncbi:hypothetical protein HMI55_001130 [Coelomomyces lativittatus]|nr:hypothetical protein HMI55_001130 [Coelomomyces lativittatus]
MPTCIRVKPSSFHASINKDVSKNCTHASSSAFPTELDTQLLATTKLSDHDCTTFPNAALSSLNHGSPIKPFNLSLRHSKNGLAHSSTSSSTSSFTSTPFSSSPPIGITKLSPHPDLNPSSLSSSSSSSSPSISFLSNSSTSFIHSSSSCSSSHSSSSIEKNNTLIHRCILSSHLPTPPIHFTSSTSTSTLSSSSSSSSSTTSSSLPISVQTQSMPLKNSSMTHPPSSHFQLPMPTNGHTNTMLPSWITRVTAPTLQCFYNRSTSFKWKTLCTQFTTFTMFKRTRSHGKKGTQREWSGWLPWTPAEIEKIKNMFVPLLSLVSFIFVFFGPAYIPSYFSLVCALFFPFFLIVYCTHFFRFTYAAYKIHRNLKQWKTGVYSRVPFQHVHAIIVPSYKESLELLQASISFLANQKEAKRHYVLALAMEQREIHYEKKAQALMEQFQSKFLDMVLTVHPKDLPGECPGKGSNVSWAAEKLHDHFVRHQVNIEKVILTVTDADAVIPELYFCELERVVKEDQQKSKFHFFSPAIFFAQNPTDVPAPVRVTDAAWSVGVIQNLSNFGGLHFPCSTYSLSMSLAKHVGWWDTHEYAIGEDLHMFLKCFYLSNTQARSTPIFVPINLANVQTDTYLSNLKARFIQARRHFQGFADTLYAFRQTFYPLDQDHTHFWIRFLCLLHVFEAQIVPAISCLTFLAAPVSFQV